MHSPWANNNSKPGKGVGAGWRGSTGRKKGTSLILSIIKIYVFKGHMSQLKEFPMAKVGTY